MPLKQDPERSIDIDRLYAAVDDEAAFRALPDAIASECGGRSSLVLYHDRAANISIPLMTYLPPDACARYFAEFGEADPWTDAVKSNTLANGRAFACDDVLSPAAFTQTAMYNELIRPLGDDTGRCLGLVMQTSGRWFQVGVQRAAGDRPFGDLPLVRLNALRPHLMQVIRLRALLAAERGDRRRLEAMLDASDRAMLIVDGRLGIVAASAAAETLLKRRDGLASINRRLHLDSSAALADLKAAVHDMLAGGALDREIAMLCPRRSGRAAFRILILPIDRSLAGQALLVIDDPAETPTDRFKLIAQAYRLTPAEALLAEGLLKGETPQQIAERRGIGHETIRTQMKSLFARTGTSRQTELIRLLANFPTGRSR